MKGYGLGILGLMLLSLMNQVHGLTKGFVPAYDPLCNIGYSQERYMAVAWDCTGWIDCVSRAGGGFAAVWTLCPPNLSFSAISRNCVAKTKCPEEKPTSVSFCQSGISPNMAFKHPDSCAMYYQCNNTTPHTNLRVYENECGADMLFDERDGICKSKHLVECGKRPLPTGTCGYKKLCRLPECRGLPNGYFPLEDAPFTAEYFECITGQFIAVRKCIGAGEIFDPATRKCAPGVIPTSAKAFCAVNPRAKFADPASCSLFFDCSKYEHDSNLYPYQAECVYLYLYDIKVKRCVYFLQADCQSRPEPRAPCEYRRGHCYGRNHDQCIACDANCVTLPDGLNVYPGRSLTPYYLLCAAGRTVNVKVCPDSQVFDPIVGGCVSEIATDTMKLFCEANPGTVIAHPGECAMYYDCSQTSFIGNFKIYEKECKYPNLFDSGSIKCIDFFNVTCEKRREPISPCDYLQYQCTDKSCVPCNQVLPDCTGRVDGYYTVPRWELTSSYIVCQNFRFMFRYDCPPGQVFDILEKRCATSITHASMNAYCKKYPAGRIGNPLHCAQYYDCTAPMASRLVECPYPKLFSYEYMECQPFEKVDCGRRIDFKNPCDYQRFYTCSSHDPAQCPPCESLYPSCHLQPEGFISALPGTNNQYYFCKRGRAVLKNCRTTYSAELMRCLDPEPKLPTVAPQLPFQPNIAPQVPFQPIIGIQPFQPSIPTDPFKLFTPGVQPVPAISPVTQPPPFIFTLPPTTPTPTTPAPTTPAPTTQPLPTTPPPTTQPPTTPAPTTPPIARPGEAGFDINTYCARVRYDIFPHPNSCAKYYNCMVPSSVFGPYVMECPYPDLYDFVSRTCKLFSVANCVPGIFQPVAPCEYGKYNAECQNRNCPPCESSNPSCKGLPDGRHTFPDDPLGPRFVECQFGRTMKVTKCPSEMFFDPQLKRCNNELTRNTIETYCKQNPDTNAQHPFNCAQFIKCTKNSTLVVECGYPRLFNKINCDDFKKVQCQQRYKPIAPCEYAQNRRCPPGTPSCKPCEERIPSCVGLPNNEQPYPGRAPSPLFLVCDTGRTTAVMQCLKNIFNPTDRKCSGAISNAHIASICTRHPQATFPDPQNCARYFNCSMKEMVLDKPYQAECKYPDLFSTLAYKCERFHVTMSAGGCGIRYPPVEPCEYRQHCPTFPNCDLCKRRVPNCNVPSLNDPGLNLLPNNAVPYPTEWYICLDKRTIAHGSCEPGQFFNSTARDCRPMPRRLV